ncbi:GNAT family N-acetyltransferase [Pseudonocardia spirodelae]|uniref:GNAT family N-acetyltransferase n=1 Tax=Pseudonocardia spirodelae TaxID=3133431 RepID=A0ABU8TAL3_9PSEU
MTVATVLLHLCTPGEWRSWLDAGAVAPPSLDEAGFVHLSTPEQVALPAERLFAGRTDLVLLVLDPARLDAAGVRVRWEPGVPGDPESMRFPHAYGPVPLGAVLAVVAYRPGPDGFTAPAVPEPTAAFRASAFEASMLRRAADAEEPVTGGVAIRTDEWPVSRMHNRLQIDRPHLTDAVVLAREADRALVAHGRAATAFLDGPGARELATGLTAAGWAVSALDVLAGPAGRDATGAAARAVEVDADVVREFRLADWRTALPDLPDGQLAQLVDRDAGTARAVAMHHVAVLDDGVAVATGTLERDGATAWVDGLTTAPAHRGRGHGRALLARCRELAAEYGCDLVALGADADDWPREWYLRAGFSLVGRQYEAIRRP